jgi:hypothetical protein
MPASLGGIVLIDPNLTPVGAKLAGFFHYGQRVGAMLGRGARNKIELSALFH